ncbi:MAG: hypothetical protein HY558_07335, partial [Euryarchaeota archaeon]|nr:hypothetical protein [Euryarchaeota archaeon]
PPPPQAALPPPKKKSPLGWAVPAAVLVIGVVLVFLVLPSFQSQQGLLSQIVPTPAPGRAGPLTPTPGTLGASSSPNSPALATAQGTIRAAQGGTVTSATGDLSLTVPPGAMTRDNPITVNHVAYPRQESGLLMGEVVFGPPGLTFQKPATLTVKLPQPPTQPDDIAVYTLSTSNTPTPVGGEISRFERIADTTYDARTGTLQVPVRHFSVLAIANEKPAYLVFDIISGKYLKKGDLLYTLTGKTPGSGGFWWPGHVALYLGTRDPASKKNDGTTIIESTQQDLKLGYTDGVQFSRYSELKTYGIAQSHIFMGARRPTFAVTDPERDKIATWAISKLNTPYSPVGGPWMSEGSLAGQNYATDFLRNFQIPLVDAAVPIELNGLSCTGLVEGAYEAGTGKKIVPWYARAFLWPIRQFDRTLPVRDAMVEPGETFEMFIKGVVKPPKGWSTLNPWAADYYDDDKYYTRAMAILPGSTTEKPIKAKRANFIDLNGLFTFTPTQEDAGQHYVFTFTIDATKGGREKITDQFTIRVNGTANTTCEGCPGLVDYMTTLNRYR